MTTVNKPLQKRAGRNIGVQALPVFLQAAGAPEIAVPTNNTVTTLLEAVENALRTPFTRGEKSGFVFSDEASDTDYGVYFRDSLGNEMLIAIGTVPAGAGSGVIPGYPLDLSVDGSTVNPFTPAKPLSLFDGEKIVIRALPAPPPVP